MSTEKSALDRLVTPSVYQASRDRIFPSESSLRWHLRVHRAELEIEGAVVRLAGRLLVDPDRLDETILKLARRSAQSA